MVYYQFIKSDLCDLNGPEKISPQSWKISKFSQTFHFLKILK